MSRNIWQRLAKWCVPDTSLTVSMCYKDWHYITYPWMWETTTNCTCLVCRTVATTIQANNYVPPYGRYAYRRGV